MEKWCPKCGGDMGKYPARSREAGFPYVCSPCGQKEAVVAFMRYQQAQLQKQVNDIENAIAKMEKGEFN